MCFEFLSDTPDDGPATYPRADLDLDESDCCETYYSLYCTRPAGHDGPHVAHGTRGQEVGRWED